MVTYSHTKGKKRYSVKQPADGARAHLLLCDVNGGVSVVG